MNTYVNQGWINFYCEATEDGVSLEALHRPLYDEKTPEYLKELFATIKYYGDLFSGEEFLKMVEDGCIMNYDGVIDKVFVNHCVSNLGLRCGNFMGGDFLVDPVVWRRLCKEYTVEVVWANK